MLHYLASLANSLRRKHFMMKWQMITHGDRKMHRTSNNVHISTGHQATLWNIQWLLIIPHFTSLGVWWKWCCGHTYKVMCLIPYTIMHFNINFDKICRKNSKCWGLTCTLGLIFKRLSHDDYEFRHIHN